MQYNPFKNSMTQGTPLKNLADDKTLCKTLEDWNDIFVKIAIYVNGWHKISETTVPC